MNLINKWKEYDAKTLIPPSIVQHDILGKEHLIWVWDGENIKQFSRTTFDEKKILEDVMVVVEEPVIIDSKDVVIEELKNTVSILEDEKTNLLREKEILISEKAVLLKNAEAIKEVK